MRSSATCDDATRCSLTGTILYRPRPCDEQARPGNVEDDDGEGEE